MSAATFDPGNVPIAAVLNGTFESPTLTKDALALEIEVFVRLWHRITPADLNVCTTSGHTAA